MRTSGRGATSLVMVLVLGACAAPIDVQTPTVAQTQAAPPTAPEPTPVMSPGAVPASTVVPAGAAPPVDCGGAAVSTAIIDYVANAEGVPDILVATQGFVGVLPTDTIVVEPTATVVVRGGRPIWRGDWFDGGRGYLLNTAMACQDAGIRSH
jgi:hypothetical protein